VLPKRTEISGIILAARCSFKTSRQPCLSVLGGLLTWRFHSPVDNKPHWQVDGFWLSAVFSADHRRR
jgi:hypothetical protein